MNYAQQQLHEVIACLEIARLAERTLLQQARAFRLGEPVLLTLNVGSLTTTAPCPAEVAGKPIDALLEQATARVKGLEEMEADCIRDILLLAQRERRTQGDGPVLVPLEQPVEGPQPAASYVI